MKEDDRIVTQLERVKSLLWLIFAALLGIIGYSATPFNKTELGAAVGVLALFGAAVIVLVAVLRAFVRGIRELGRLSSEVEAVRREEYKHEVDPK